MRPRVFRGAFIFLALLLAGSGTNLSRPASGSPTSQSWTSSDRLVAAYYFYWYDIYTNLHFIDPDGSDALTDHPPDAYLPDFSYTEIDWHRRELMDLLAARIDIVLPVYWGSSAEKFWSIPGLQKLVQAEQAMLQDGLAPPKIGMFYDTTALQQQNGGTPPDLATPAGKELFYSMIADFFEEVPSDLWAAIDGQPLVWLYTAQYVSNYDQSTFDYTASRFLADFGVMPYFVREITWEGVSTPGVYPWGVALNGPVVLGTLGTLGPGYDESAVYGRDNPRVRDRECGYFYADAWEQIANSGARLVGIETWNELHEGTEIAASREYSRTYITLSAQWIERWKSADYSSAPLVWLDLGRFSYAHGLRPAFNYPDGAWLATRQAGRQAASADLTSDPISYYIYLEVNDDFLHATASEVWVTVEYFDGGTDRWLLEYDALSQPYKASADVNLTNSGVWKRHTFQLNDAYFAGRQNNGADLRLANVAWVDGATNYFGRIWVSKSAPANQAPDLFDPPDLLAPVGGLLEIPLQISDADGSPPMLAIENSPSFASLRTEGGATYLRLAPTLLDDQICPYRIRLIAQDSADSSLADASLLTVELVEESIFLPVICRP